MSKTLVSFIAFMFVGVTGLFAYKLFDLNEEDQAEIQQLKMNHPLRGKDVLVSGTCYPHSQEISRISVLHFNKTKVEILEADPNNKNIVAMVKEEQIFKLNGVKFNTQGFMIKCNFEKSPFSIVKVD